MLEQRSAVYQAFMRQIYSTAEQRHRDSAALADIRRVMEDVGRAFPLAHDIRVTPVDCDGVGAEWVDAPESAADRIVLYAHGGCYISGAAATVREFCSRLARDGRCRVLSVDYRLAEVSFGASLKRNLGVDMASVEPLRIGARLYAGDANRRHPLASPLYGDLRGLPPMLIQVGTADVLLDEGLEIARRLAAAGCAVTLREWPDMIHVWHWFGSLFPEAREAIAEIGRYVLAHVPDATQRGCEP